LGNQRDAEVETDYMHLQVLYVT